MLLRIKYEYIKKLISFINKELWLEVHPDYNILEDVKHYQEKAVITVIKEVQK